MLNQEDKKLNKNKDPGFVVLKNITKSFGAHTVIDDLNLSIKKGTMVTLLGPSGCGKTTVLRLVAGLELPTAGQVFIDGEDVTQTSIWQRDIGIVFQSYALFPHMSIGENVGYGLKMLGIDKYERHQRILEALTLVDLDGFAERFVDQISGGQQQRVALARALILKPKVLLFDEPLSNLDANLRRSMRDKISTLQKQLNITSIYVTHDQSEAFAVSDEVVVMQSGKIMQQAPAGILYRYPNSLFMANFMGESNIMQGYYDTTTCKLDINGYLIDLDPNYLKEHDIQHRYILKQGRNPYLIGIRPEAFKLVSTKSQDNYQATQKCIIQKSIYMGAHWELELLWQKQLIMLNVNQTDFQADANADQQEVYLVIDPKGIFLLEVE
ncbi:ferric transporter subunit [Gammaproteobacteria bacterium]|nr:ferric transporter subunit [Gammaproteobacteria bacterium]